MPPTLIEKLKAIVAVLTSLPNCRPVSVGGSVRDAIMTTEFMKAQDSPVIGEQVLDGFELVGKDFDLEIFGARSFEVSKALIAAGIEIELVGRAFPVYKVKGFNIDISFPRREVKVGDKHTDFIIECDPNMSFKEAAERRDFTCNAIGYDWTTNRVLDPWNGLSAIQSNILSCVSDKFEEDALRALRAFKFVARLGLFPDYGTELRCIELFPQLATYAKERLLPEWIDFILHADSRYIAKAFKYLDVTGAGIVFPELLVLIGCRQDPDHHPEGDVWTHTMHCLEYFAKHVRPRLANDEERLIVGFAVLTHDFGKVTCTVIENDQVMHAHGHEDSPLPRQFLERLFDPADDRIRQIELLVKAHMRPVLLAKGKAKTSAVRRLNVAVEGRIDRLLAVVECDQGGRPPKPVDRAAIAWVEDKCGQLNMPTTIAIKPFIQGRHLITHLKLRPSKIFKPILDILFEAQLDGVFENEEEGIKHLIACYRAED